ncbi:MAG TPA: ATP-binding protein [Chloroflexota bacterium]|nr:ATP-binding protein [Chloroflexota bacterium]
MNRPADDLAEALNLESWGYLEKDGHSVRFYAEDAFLVDGLAAFVGSALARGRAAVVIATPEHRQALRHALAERGLNASVAQRQGRYVDLDARATLDAFMVDGWPDQARFEEVVGAVLASAAAAAGGRRERVAAFGEMVALLCEDGLPGAALHLERLWNALAEKHSFHLHCAYRMGAFGDAAGAKRLAEVCAEHTDVVPAESWTALQSEEDKQRQIVFLQQKAEALEQEIERRHALEQNLRDAVAARDAFLSIAAHELRTPITSLRGFAQLLLRTVRADPAVPAERLAMMLQTVEQQTGKLAGLIGRLLDASQIEAGKLRLDARRTDLAELVQAAIAGLPLRNGVRVQYTGPEHLAARVDVLRLEEVVTNLVENALKFSPEGGTVRVELGLQASGGVELCVSDEGVGVPEDEREAIFNRFYQAGNASSISGMGLGLFVSRQIVELHGGRIRVEDAAGAHGARFTISLPAECVELHAESVA